MSDWSRHTKAQLIEEIESYRGEQKKLVEQLNAVPPAPKAVPEAVALAGCIRALDILNGETPNRGHFDPFNVRAGQRAVEQLLRMLASRYGVDLVEVQVEPCRRSHVDEMDLSFVADAIRNAPKQVAL